MERWEAGLYRFDRPKSMILILPVSEMRMFSILRSGGGMSNEGCTRGCEEMVPL